MNEMQVFENSEFGSVRGIEIDGEIHPQARGERMREKASHNITDLESASAKICMDCPMADCDGGKCAYLRDRLAEMGFGGRRRRKENAPVRKQNVQVRYCVEYEGKLYTIRQMAEMSGMGLSTTKSRYIYGWTGKEMMQGYRDPKPMRRENNRTAEQYEREGKKYEYEGKLYTAKQMTELCGVSRTAVYHRLRVGWTVKEILQNHREGRGKPSEDIHTGGSMKVVEYEGRKYTTKELSQICGKPRVTIQWRMRNGWTAKEILQNHRDERKVYGYGQDSHPKSEREQGLDGA